MRFDLVRAIRAVGSQGVEGQWRPEVGGLGYLDVECRLGE